MKIRVIMLICITALACVDTSVFAAVGRIAGQYAVSPLGGAQYSIPIWSPPGIHGVQPTLALLYDSHAGLGTMGPGWTLAGLSSIYRCNATFAQDPTPSGVTLTQSDRFCLDGKRLRLTSSDNLSTYGAASTTYQTEVADFSLVTASSTYTGNGPSYFLVRGRNGLTYEYGKTANAQVLAPGSTTPYVWALDKVTDRAGNYMAYTYAQNSGSFVVSSIQYTAPVGSTTFLYQIDFLYTNLPVGAASVMTAYIAGSQVQQTQELKSITVEQFGTTTDLRVYNLSYSPSPTTSRDTLTTITECSGSSGTDCLPATMVGYQPGASGVVSPSTSSGSGATSGVAYSVDLDGDGRADLVFATISGSNYQWWVQFATATGYGLPVSTGVVTAGSANFLVDTFEGTPQNEILAPVGGVWEEFKWNGSVFSATLTGITVITNAQYSSADVDGDGRPDLVSMLGGDPNAACVNTLAYPSTVVSVQLNTMTTGLSFAAPVATYANCASQFGSPKLIGNNQLQTSAVKKFDFDGDQRQDLIFTWLTINSHTKPVTITSGAVELLSRGTSPVSFGFTIPSTNMIAVNWNDDGCTDMVSSNPGVTPDYHVWLSQCNSAAYGDIPLTGVVPVLALDWDGDGRTDLLGNVNGLLEVYRSLGTTYAAAATTGISVGNGNFVVTDQNGDGLDDLVFANSASNYSLSYGVHNGAFTPPDLAISFIDAFGNSQKPTYVGMLQTSYSPWNDQVFPYENYVGSYYIVNGTTFSDPSSLSGATYSIDYWYAGAALNLQGRGFVGFGAFQTYDSRSGIWSTMGVARTFPYTGRITSEEDDLNNTSAQNIRSWSGTKSVVVLDSTPKNDRYFTYLSPITANNYEVGAKIGTLITSTTTTYGSPDTYGNFADITATVTDQDAGSPYYGENWTTTTATSVSPNAADWCINLPTQKSLTKAAPGVSSITRTSTFTPDYANCRDTQEVIAPSTAYQVTIGYAYDSFGNLNSQTVTGNGMAARTTQYYWGTTGQFLHSVTDPASQTTTYGFDPDSGLQASQTDPNGITISWQYDDFARKNKEIRPDGTYSTWTYNPCSSCDPLPRVTVVEQRFGTNNQLITTTSNFYDAIDRQIYTESTLLSGATAWSAVHYFDSLGRIWSEQFPYLTSGSRVGGQTYAFDTLNRVVTIQRPISASNSNKQNMSITHSGRSTSIKDWSGNTTTYINQVTGNMGRSQGPNGYAQNFMYDAFGSLTAVTDNANPSNTLFTASYVYGAGAYQTATSDMDRGAWTYTPDALGEFTGYTDAKSQRFSVTYDALSRPQVRTEPDLTTTWNWGATKASNNIGKLQSIIAAGSAGIYSESYTYDTDGRLSSKTLSLPGDATYTYTNTYSATTGFLDTLQYPQSTAYQLKLQYGYANGILNSIADFNAPSTVFWTANATNPRQQITQETLGNGVVRTRGYDPVTGWLGSIQAGVSAGSALQNNAFLYDYDGNVTQRQDNNQGLTENFYYDTMNRLDHSTLNGAVNLQMTYDSLGMGNIASRSDVAGGASWTYDPVRKHAVTQAGSSAFTYSYDANGNAATRNGSLIGWTTYNYPSSVTAGSESVEFYYGPQRNRWKTIYSGSIGTEITYHVDKLLEKVANDGVSDYRYYIYAGPELIGIYSRMTSGTNTMRYILEDHESSFGSIDTGTTPGSDYVNESFTPFGNRRSGETWAGAPTDADETAINAVSRRGYTGETVLGVSMGLIHLNGRVEDAVTGRFLSPDPNVPNFANTQSFNRYSYVNNNPLTQVDPTGFENKYPSFGGGSGAFIWGATDVSFNSGLTLVAVNGGPFYSGTSIATSSTDPTSAFDQWVSAAVGGSVQRSSTTPSIDVSNDIPWAQLAQSQMPSQGCPSGSCLDPITVEANRLTDGLYTPVVTWPGVSSWTNFGNLANGALYLALLHNNPTLAGRLRPERPVPGGGRIDELLDNNFAFELKPDSWQVGDYYASSISQLSGYLSAGGYSAGSWSSLTNAATIGVGGYFTGYGISGNLFFLFHADAVNPNSGLIFYQTYGTYSITPGVDRSSSGLTFFP